MTLAMGAVESRAGPTVAWPASINLILVGHVALVVAFDHLEERTRIVAAATLAVAYATLAAYAILRRGDRLALSLALALLAVPLAWLGCMVFASPDWQGLPLEVALRNLAPYIAGIAIIANRDRLSTSLLLALGGVICGSALVTAFTSPAVMLGGTARWHPFSAGLHTSAYAAAATIILGWECVRLRAAPPMLLMALMFAAAIVLYNYHVRTALLLVFAYAVARLVIDNFVGRKRLLLAGAAAIALAVLIALVGPGLVTTQWDELNSFSSGRISNYFERFQILLGRDLGEVLFGTGPGSDRIIVSTWWWEEKDSHSDFLQVYWEGGLTALLGILALLAIVLRARPAAMLPLVAAVVATSSISNALLARPNVSFIFFCAVALALRRPAAAVRQSATDEAKGEYGRA